MHNYRDIHYENAANLSNVMLNALWRNAYPAHMDRDFTVMLNASECIWTAWMRGQLIGFARAIGDKDRHAFLLDPIVHADWRRKGIGRQLVGLVADEAQKVGYTYLHVDFEAKNAGFYEALGFKPSLAGIKELGPAQS